MSHRLLQLQLASAQRIVVVLDDDGDARQIGDFESVYELARSAMRSGEPLEEVVRSRRSSERIDIAQAQSAGQLLPPIDHPDPSHLLLTGTGLTHLSSATSRDAMHGDATQTVTDSMRMFDLGVEGGKPADGEVGVQPEWFYKGNGSSVVGTGTALVSPPFALDGSEEPEIAGIYIIDNSGTPRRLGFCLANEFSDHVVERGNYLWLAHSKLRPAALGAELMTTIPGDIRGTSKILRGGKTIWEKSFLTGEANMSHSLRNLEYHHFKYAVFRQPGDVHVHFFGTATLSFADGVRTEPGDVFEITAEPFLLALRNPLTAADDTAVEVRAL